MKITKLYFQRNNEIEKHEITFQEKKKEHQTLAF